MAVIWKLMEVNFSLLKKPKKTKTHQQDLFDSMKTNASPSKGLRQAENGF